MVLGASYGHLNGFWGGFYSDPNVLVNSPCQVRLINHALPERFNNALGEISDQEETCGSIIFWVSVEI
jgi:hypothetical protein